MSPLNKIGTPEKILNLAKNAEEFAKLWEDIEKKNDLVKCQNCKHLLSKKSDGAFTIKHKKLAAVISGGNIKIVCPVCNTVNDIK